MSKIPKEIVDKIEQRNKLNEEIETWCKEHLDMDGMDSDCADITDHHIGKEQGNDECKEWSEQWSGYEDAEEKDRLGQWIPCSERLPEEEEYILLSFANYTGLDIGRYENDGENDKFYPGDEEETYASYGLIVNAWMPLPEPYREEE